MIRHLILLGFFAAFTLPAHAAPPQTVQELERILAAPPAGSDSLTTDQIDENTDLLQQLRQDAILAPRVAAVELSERLTVATLQKLVAAYSLGPQTQQALDLLADRSALLDPPPGEMPRAPTPDEDTQRRMIEEARAYVLSILPHLPDLFAIRATSRFGDIPMKSIGRDLPTRPGLQLEGTSSREITFNDGKEVYNPVQRTRPSQPPESGLESQGEFGPEPAIILSDIRGGAIAFHHWEQASGGMAAVFRYSVPGSASHYEVNYSCRSRAFHNSPAYHGSLSIDPSSGAILRVTLQADWKTGDPVSHVASVIEYGPIVLGGRRYICPLRSLAFMVEEPNGCGLDTLDHRARQPVAMLNRTRFTDYHRLGTASRIILDGAVDPAPAPAPASPPASRNPSEATSTAQQNSPQAHAHRP